MVARFIETPQDLEYLGLFLATQKLPLVVTIEKGAKKSTAQNRLAHLWTAEIAHQLGDTTPNEVRAELKLTFGIPILAEDEQFRIKWQEVAGHLGYEQKLALMVEPFDFPVSRLFTVKQGSAYLDAIHRRYSGMGIRLTDPGDLLLAAYDKDRR